MAKILDGIRIIDFTEGHTGSYGTMLLSDFGAEVIKVEDPKRGGDVLRGAFPKNEAGSAYHAYMNRGKRSVCVDRSVEAGRDIIRELIKTADVVCDGFPAGELEKCGLDYDSMKEVKPGIIYASLTGYGKTGPLSNIAGSDLTSEALCGLMEMTGFPDGKPTAHGSRIADQFGGVFMAFSIVAALMARDENGKGQKIDISTADCMFTALEDWLMEAVMTGEEGEREGNGSRAIAPYDTFEVKDGYISTAVSTNRQWAKFCEAMGMEELIDDPRYDTNENRGEHYYGEDGLRKKIADKFRDMSKWEVEELLRPWNIPSGPGFTVKEAFENEQLNSRNMVVEIEDKALGRIKMPGIPIKISGINDKPTGSAPLLGEDTEPLLKEICRSDEEISRLADEHVILCEGRDA